jgi:CRISPR-associated endonuclease Cas1
MSSSDPLSAWYRLGVSLRCERSRDGQEWFPFVIRALFKSVCQEAFTFHSAGGPLPQAPKPGETYRLCLYLPRCSGEEALRVRERLEVGHFENFTLAGASEPERRDLEILRSEDQTGAWTSGEICLDFETPLLFDPPVPDDFHRLDSAKLLRLLDARAAHVLGTSLLPKEKAELLTIPWFAQRSKPRSRDSRSTPGHRETVAGLIGPVYLKGELDPLRDLLLLAQELHFGKSLPCGLGRFMIRQGRPALKPAFGNPSTWIHEKAILAEDPVRREDWLGPAAPGDEEIAEIAAAAQEGRFPQEPAARVVIQKSGGGERIVAKLAPRTYLFHRVLLHVLGPAIEKRLSPSALAYRPGRGVKDARPFMSAALDAGCTHVAKADIASFFDEIPWAALRECLGDFLPVGDAILREAAEAAFTLPFREGPKRVSGVPQGSPFSPSIANLFLAGWDDAMTSRGHRMIRYGDDLLIATVGEDAARLALADASMLLSPLGLKLKPEKTSIQPIAEGVRHLGLNLGGEDGDVIEQAAPGLRKTLYLTKADQWAGIDHAAITVREGTHLVHRIPLLRIHSVVILGIGGVSTAFVNACIARGAPITFADHSGKHRGTLHSEPRICYMLAEDHSRARWEMGADAVAAVARTIVRAKLTGYLDWADSITPPGAALLRDAARAGVQSLEKEPGIPSAMGIEGAAARKLHRAVNDLACDPFWQSKSREAHARKDPWNLLVDTLSFLLFTRINSLVRARGLNPFLGFLHSPKDRFESLVCDLQEPFRARIERLAVRIVNLHILTTEHACKKEAGDWTWTGDAWQRVIREFETELDRRRGRDLLTWRIQIEHLVEMLRLWALARIPHVDFSLRRTPERKHLHR